MASALITLPKFVFESGMIVTFKALLCGHMDIQGIAGYGLCADRLVMVLVSYLTQTLGGKGPVRLLYCCSRSISFLYCRHLKNIATIRTTYHNYHIQPFRFRSDTAVKGSIILQEYEDEVTF